MRFVIEVLPGPDDRVEGTVQGEGPGPPVPFCGWLELLRLLEPGPSRPQPADGPPAAGAHQSAITLAPP